MARCPTLTFASPDLDTFPCLRLAMEAARRGGSAGAVLNGANEAAVQLFLRGRIPFVRIPELVGRALEEVPVVRAPTLDDVLAADAQARQAVVSQL